MLAFLGKYRNQFYSFEFPDFKFWKPIPTLLFIVYIQIKEQAVLMILIEDTVGFLRISISLIQTSNLKPHNLIIPGFHRIQSIRYILLIFYFECYHDQHVCSNIAFITLHTKIYTFYSLLLPPVLKVFNNKIH